MAMDMNDPTRGSLLRRGFIHQILEQWKWEWQAGYFEVPDADIALALTMQVCFFVRVTIDKGQLVLTREGVSACLICR
jgi:hypothetical protein